MSAQRMMTWWYVGVMAFGVVLAGAGFAATGGPAWLLLDWFGGTAVTPTPPLRFAVGLMGAVSLGWGATALAVTTIGAELPEEPRSRMWTRIGWAVLAWYLIDSSISIATGFWPNAVSNTALAGTFWAIRRWM